MGVRLPSEYQEVEYIKGSSSTKGANYIDTGIAMHENTAVEIVCASSFAADNTRPAFDRLAEFGSVGWIEFSGTASSPVATFKFSGVNKSTPFQDGTNHEILVAGSAWYLDGVLLYEHTGSTYADANIILLGQQFATGDRDGRLLIYSCIIREGSEKKAEFVPCYRKSDSEPGMYDLVTNQFFTNAGTGEFLVGPDVIDSISPWLMARRRALMARKPFDCPYVKDGLVFWLDGIRKGDDPTVWKDLVRGIAFDMSGVTFTTNGVEFVSGSYGAYDGNIAVAWDVGTIEACVDYASYQTAILSQKSYSPTPLSLINGTGANVGYAADGQARPRGNATYGWKTLSVNADLVVRNGTSVGFGTNDSWIVNPDRYTYLGIRRSDLSSYRFTGTMYAIRIYNRKLTEQEMIFNQSVDNNRFNLGLNI